MVALRLPLPLRNAAFRYELWKNQGCRTVTTAHLSVIFNISIWTFKGIFFSFWPENHISFCYMKTYWALGVRMKCLWFLWGCVNWILWRTSPRICNLCELLSEFVHLWEVLSEFGKPWELIALRICKSLRTAFMICKPLKTTLNIWQPLRTSFKIWTSLRIALRIWISWEMSSECEHLWELPSVYGHSW